MINVLFFAQVRELLGTPSIQLEAGEHVATAAALREHLAAKNEKWARVLESDKLLVAVNQTLSNWHAEVRDGDEVAFFPPVTGG
ncbi:molybdopterin synthase sulfur carrier subunit [Shewanella yunxiaonensis]|uniref:Molybdopterin synthase sulfur carrier subunit n=1 Tax=Shewanella yunxiaonensis TaxID=2829809 RepID=A0ABX7YTH3_9GAMM|nr:MULTISPECIES: molybdopterin synthase sulfur carrier subunit [Shewanella]MDF0534610.1 molybdopterin synthase sulfur carrier subunit [Shewanella sp. A32]QUN06012.1 molybdopterin synthase sulfur carrier subunit [Shewanella yunxiaonensis]